MAKRKMKIVPSRSVFVDVDDTLVKWEMEGSSFENHPECLVLDMFGTPKRVLPMWGNINKVKAFYEKGYEVVIWSLSSKQWAEQVVKRLGLEEWVDFCVSKPDFYIDDKDASHFMLEDKRVYIPRND